MLSSFAAHVSCVIGVRTNKEMTWVDAPSVIAGVANEHIGVQVSDVLHHHKSVNPITPT